MLKLKLQLFAKESPEEKKEELEEKKDPLEELEEEAKESPEEAKEELEEKKEELEEEMPSSTKSGNGELKQLKEIVHLQGQKMELLHNLAKEQKEEMERTHESLRETIETFQQVIGEMDSQSGALVTAAAALVKLHKEQQSRK